MIKFERVMWKYVSRRLKDTFEKTYNVLDPCRRTWTCGEKVKETNCTSHDENKCIAKYNYQLVPSSAENTNGKSNSSSSSYSFHCRTLEAITWVSLLFFFLILSMIHAKHLYFVYSSFYQCIFFMLSIHYL